MYFCNIVNRSLANNLLATDNVTPVFALDSEGISNFSFSLYGAIERSGNEFISPYSISAALLLLSLGTDGTTKKQILSSMFTTGMVNDVHMGYKTLNTKIESRANTGK
jgi:serine protease inhibitor